LENLVALTSQKPLLIFVGGFLGAGKTTLILKAAEILHRRGLRVAVVMNDQDAGLVDTLHSRALNLPASEVAGGCFCCRFSDFLDAADRLASYQPQIIFAEPVGSCVDLSATILQPLLAFHQSTYRLAPLTVLLDPPTAVRLQRGDLNPELEFLIRKQIAEADLLCLTKQDLDPELPRLTFPLDCYLSARSGAGVESWIDEIVSSNRVVGAHLLDVDYDQYALAEAALGWLNLHVSLHLGAPAAPTSVAGPLLDLLESQLTASGIEIAHLKLFDRAASGWVRASISSNRAEALPEGELLAEPSLDHELAINLRALGDPELLRAIVIRTIETFDAQFRIRHLGAFRPPRPIPEHRFTTRAQ
jgi:Ni2+-binding GTPase involved in maturation of urease and hydrogenase